MSLSVLTNSSVPGLLREPKELKDVTQDCICVFDHLGPFILKFLELSDMPSLLSSCKYFHENLPHMYLRLKNMEIVEWAKGISVSLSDTVLKTNHTFCSTVLAQVNKRWSLYSAYGAIHDHIGEDLFHPVEDKGSLDEIKSYIHTIIPRKQQEKHWQTLAYTLIGREDVEGLNHIGKYLTMGFFKKNIDSFFLDALWRPLEVVTHCPDWIHPSHQYQIIDRCIQMGRIEIVKGLFTGLKEPIPSDASLARDFLMDLHENSKELLTQLKSGHKEQVFHRLQNGETLSPSHRVEFIAMAAVLNDAPMIHQVLHSVNPRSIYAGYAVLAAVKCNHFTLVCDLLQCYTLCQEHIDSAACEAVRNRYMDIFAYITSRYPLSIEGVHSAIRGGIFSKDMDILYQLLDQLDTSSLQRGDLICYAVYEKNKPALQMLISGHEIDLKSREEAIEMAASANSLDILLLLTAGYSMRPRLKLEVLFHAARHNNFSMIQLFTKDM
ncbi:MAG: hypothetical protein EBZ47_06190 [Chlamydiae bacterium]|nr:hypothetical protein [Chlamydiota bacterium]